MLESKQFFIFKNLLSPEKPLSHNIYEVLNYAIDSISPQNYLIDPKSLTKYKEWKTTGDIYLLLTESEQNLFTIKFSTGRDEITQESITHSIVYTRNRELSATLQLSCGQIASISLCEGRIEGAVLSPRGPICFSSPLQDAEINLFQDIIKRISEIITPQSTNLLKHPLLRSKFQFHRN